jgi:hypothetical protein
MVKSYQTDKKDTVSLKKLPKKFKIIFIGFIGFSLPRAFMFLKTTHIVIEIEKSPHHKTISSKRLEPEPL